MAYIYFRVDLSSQAAKALFLPYWGACGFGPLTYVLALAHMGLSDRYPWCGRLLDSGVSFTVSMTSQRWIQGESQVLQLEVTSLFSLLAFPAVQHNTL